MHVAIFLHLLYLRRSRIRYALASVFRNLFRNVLYSLFAPRICIYKCFCKILNLRSVAYNSGIDLRHAIYH